MPQFYYLSIVACFLNENDYLKEWLDFHLLMGINHFYLYNTGVGERYLPPEHEFYIDKFVKEDGYQMVAEVITLENNNKENNNKENNNKENNNKENNNKVKYKLILEDPTPILRPYIEKGIVTCLQWNKSFDQAGIYNHAYRTYGKNSYWMAFLDIDEFLYPNNPKEDLKFILHTYRQYPSIAVHSLFFGSSGNLEKEDIPVLERFTFRASDNCPVKGLNDLTKIIAQPRYIRKFKNAHTCYLINDMKGVNTNRERVRNKACLRPIYHNVLRINHYHVKSKEEFMMRHAIGRHQDTPQMNISRFNVREDLCNQVEDYIILEVYNYKMGKIILKK
jgi:hypothetical protein